MHRARASTHRKQREGGAINYVALSNNRENDCLVDSTATHGVDATTWSDKGAIGAQSPLESFAFDFGRALDRVDGLPGSVRSEILDVAKGLGSTP